MEYFDKESKKVENENLQLELELNNIIKSRNKSLKKEKDRKYKYYNHKKPNKNAYNDISPKLTTERKINKGNYPINYTFKPNINKKSKQLKRSIIDICQPKKIKIKEIPKQEDEEIKESIPKNLIKRPFNKNFYKKQIEWKENIKKNLLKKKILKN